MRVFEVMFKKETKIILILLLCCTFFSCQEEFVVKADIDRYILFNSEYTKEIRDQIKVHFEFLVEQEREIVLPFIITKSWSIDSIIYVSQDRKRIFTQLFLRRIDNRASKVDISIEIIGASQNGKWYFLQGSTTLYPRDNYKYDYSAPFTYEEMSFLANRYLFPRVVSYKDGEYNVSKEFFSSLLGELDSSKKDGDSLFIERVNGYSSKSVPKEKLERIRKEQRESKPITVAKPTLWSQWFAKKKLFDSKEWKNRRKE